MGERCHWGPEPVGVLVSVLSPSVLCPWRRASSSPGPPEAPEWLAPGPEVGTAVS